MALFTAITHGPEYDSARRERSILACSLPEIVAGLRTLACLMATRAGGARCLSALGRERELRQCGLNRNNPATARRDGSSHNVDTFTAASY